MFNDYSKVKKILRSSFGEILSLIDEKELTYDEIKDLLVKTLYTVKVEDKKVENVQSVVMPQVLYGPPQMFKEEVHEVVMPQVLYGPPPIEEIHVMMADGSLDYGEGFIQGTNIHVPREKKVNETEEEYLAYLDQYYSKYFPEKKGGRARR